MVTVQLTVRLTFMPNHCAILLLTVGVDNFKLNIDGVNGSENDEASNARARLAQEAQEMRRAPLRPEPKGIRDVTAKFFTASKQLPSGELVKDDFFTLFEAVGALEVCVCFIYFLGI